MMEIPFYQVDAFTSKVFSGNPAAVCPLENWIEDEIMQMIAAENNLSETAFLVRNGDHYDIRWFTPKVEVDLCGHATLAASLIIFNHLGYDDGSIRFQSRSGELRVFRSDEVIMLDFPSDEPLPYSASDEILHAVGRQPVGVYKGKTDLLMVYENEQDILALTPDFEKLKRKGTRGVIVTAPGDQVDFVSRFFAPAVGINEDPVTGSAHTLLTPYWSKRLGKKELTAHQLSERKGRLLCRQRGDRVLIGGNAVLFCSGTITI